MHPKFAAIAVDAVGKNLPDTQYIMSVDQNPTEVTQVTTEKDLGVIFHEKLIFRDHISKRQWLEVRIRTPSLPG